MGYIYKITNNINNKIYIGKTELSDPECRWKEHLRDYKRIKNEKRPLYEAMNKYGVENFYFEIIEETDNTEEREKYWINELRTYIGFKDCNGYNATLGGDGKCYLNLNEEEVIKYHTEEASYVLSDTAKYFNVDRSSIKKILKKHNIPCMKYSDVYSMRFFIENGAVVQISTQTKMIIEKFKNITDVVQELNFSMSSISEACHNRRGNHYAHGYLWYFEKDLEKAIDNGDLIQIKQCPI